MKNLLKNFRSLYRAIWLYMPAALGISFIYYVLMALPIASDTLMLTGESWVKMGALLFIICLWSYIVWFSTWIVGQVSLDTDVPANKYIEYLPHFFSINCFVAIQCSILALKNVINMSGLVIILFIALHAILYVIMVSDFSRKVKTIIPIIASVIYLVFLFFLFLENNRRSEIKHGWTLVVLCASLYCFEIVLLIGINVANRFFHGRTPPSESRIEKKIDKLYSNKLSKKCESYLLKLKIPKGTASIQSFALLVFFVLFFIMAIIYLVAIKSVWFASTLGPLALSLLSISLLITFFNAIGVFSRHFNFNFNLLILTVAFIMGSLTIKHQVRTVRTINNPTTQRIVADSFFNRWINNPVRLQEIRRADSASPYIAYLVLSDGGGARAATWTTKSLTQIDMLTHGEFRKHIFAMVGASGGSIGNVAYYGVLKDLSLQNNNIAKHQVDEFYRRDFLSYTLARLFGPDFFSYLSPFNLMDDRAAALETTFENNSTNPNLIAAFFSQSADTAFDYSGKLPALLINTTDVKYGSCSVVSNIELNNTLRKNVFNQICPGKTIRMSTAAILSARFPYISPAGEINGKYYVDGGYFDNSGAGTMMTLMNEYYKNLDSLRKHIVFRIIEIHNSSKQDENEYHIHPMINDLFAPIQTLIGTTDANTRSENILFEDYMAHYSSLVPVKLELYNPNLIDEEPYPMSWINSQYQLTRMDERLQYISDIDTSIFNPIHRDLHF